jgi:hypothetical protein
MLLNGLRRSLRENGGLRKESYCTLSQLCAMAQGIDGKARLTCGTATRGEPSRREIGKVSNASSAACATVCGLTNRVGTIRKKYARCHREDDSGPETMVFI